VRLSRMFKGISVRGMAVAGRSEFVGILVPQGIWSTEITVPARRSPLCGVSGIEIPVPAASLTVHPRQHQPARGFPLSYRPVPCISAVAIGSGKRYRACFAARPLTAFWYEPPVVQFTVGVNSQTQCACLHDAQVFVGGTGPSMSRLITLGRWTLSVTPTATADIATTANCCRWLRGFGFGRRLCRLYRAKTAGKVECSNGNLKDGFLVPR